MFKSIYTAVVSNIQRSLGKGSGWIIDSVIDHNISISKYNPLAGSTYIKLSKELDYPKKRLINIQNIDDNECFKWSLVRYLNPASSIQYGGVRTFLVSGMILGLGVLGHFGLLGYFWTWRY